MKDHGEADQSRIVWAGGTSDSERERATERILVDACSEVCAAACRQLGYNASENDREFVRFMKEHKGVIGGLVASEIIKEHPWETDGDKWPAPLRELINRLNEILSHSGQDDARV